MTSVQDPAMSDLFIIGGGINGCGIARDAAGRGLSVTLAEMDDLGSATSSSSTKLFHGGLRYLEYFEVRLVREALIEREVLLRNMPHISWPMRFVLPYHKDMRFETTTPLSRLLGTVMPWLRGRRPAWLIRVGLALYDGLGGRKILPGTRSLDLRAGPEGAPLLSKFTKAYEYSDCWVDDARLVALNARDAQHRGARIFPRTKVVAAHRGKDHWVVRTRDTRTGTETEHRARMLINAAGPWAGVVLSGPLGSDTRATVRLVRGSHIVTPRLFDHDKAYFLQGEDGRIIFAIPYEADFTLIGTTDADHSDPSVPPTCTAEEQAYLIRFANRYLKQNLTEEDIVWTYSGVRPLFDDGSASASALTRDYTLKLETSGGAPLLNIFGGKITTYRKLAEAALGHVETALVMQGASWTAAAPLPGGDFEVGQVDQVVTDLIGRYRFLTPAWALRLVRAYGTDAALILGDAQDRSDLGTYFGATLTEAEVSWMITHEFASTPDDILWRRSKLGLRMSPEQVKTLTAWLSDRAHEATHPRQSS